MSKKRIKLNIGDTFGKWVVIEECNNIEGKTYYICECQCENKTRKSILATTLKSGKSKSCGCLRKELLKEQGAKFKNKYEIFDEFVTVYDSKGDSFMIDIDDYHKLIEFNRYWYVSHRDYKGRIEKYVTSKIKGEHIKLHNFIMNPSDGKVVDHISGNVTDNRKSNLRIVTQQQNAMNRSKAINNTSGVKGVSHVKRNNKWVARIGFEGKRIVLGTFDTFDEAVKVRKDAEEKYYGEFNRIEDVNID